ncbi:MAG: histidine kinase [Anaerolineaceae bacterium]|nr:histidine kinase [Anaerolineaceae bacterium]
MTTEVQFQEENDAARAKADLSSAPIRSQLLWSSFFPLALFGLLTTLVIAISIQKITLDLAEQRNSARVQLLAAQMEQSKLTGEPVNTASLNSMLNGANAGKESSLFLIDADGHVLAASGPLNSQGSPAAFDFSTLSAASGELVQWPATQDQVLITRQPLADATGYLVLVEPWQEIVAAAAGYQMLLVVLTLLGVLLSLFMLSLAITRILLPIRLLTERAALAVPGSVFEPIPENGPGEIRSLINAFNQMVIRLAKQQITLRQYAHKSLLSQEEERQRLSRELHDGPLQDLVGLHQRIELYQNELAEDPHQAQQRLQEIDQIIDHSIEDVRTISVALRPPILDDLGLPAAIDSLCKGMANSMTGLDCAFSLVGKQQRLSSEMELAIYRVVQEALSNIRKHVPNASQVTVELVFAKTEVKATIRNDGSSFADQDVQGYVRSGHIGLAGMYERARLFGGSLKIRATENEGTIITLRLPYEI